MHEAFHPALQFHESPVGQQLGDPALDVGADRELGLDILPGVVGHLLETKGDALFFPVDVEHDNVQFFADGDQLARVIDAAPTHVGDVQQSVKTVEVNEGAEIGDVLHLALDHHARRHVLEDL